MRRLIRAELRSMRDVRSIRAIVAGAVAAAALGASFGTAGELIDLLQVEIVVMTLSGLLAGAVAGAGEIQHGTVAWTLLAAPRRPVAGVAKLAAVAVLGAGMAVAVLGATWGAGALKEGGLPAGTGVGGLVAGQLVLGMSTAAFGLAVGLVLRNLPAAVGGVLALALVIPLVFQAKQSLASEARFLPYGELSAAAPALGSAPARYGAQLTPAAAGVVLLGWTAIVSIAALARFVRQDVS
jgi:ABC-2 type transport system permease protein